MCDYKPTLNGVDLDDYVMHHWHSQIPLRFPGTPEYFRKSRMDVVDGSDSSHPSDTLESSNPPGACRGAQARNRVEQVEGESKVGFSILGALASSTSEARWRVPTGTATTPIRLGQHKISSPLPWNNISEIRHRQSSSKPLEANNLWVITKRWLELSILWKLAKNELGAKTLQFNLCSVETGSNCNSVLAAVSRCSFFELQWQPFCWNHRYASDNGSWTNSRSVTSILDPWRDAQQFRLRGHILLFPTSLYIIIYSH
ncbi:hypothetical protein DFP72DRAFT_850701 [Ephemerocybe angulata]|uniref:Uncharacterized protein n=1 Tax=Ephemerocybe angulata TaxID=980116 RepID=A0A8H6HTH6_9AGAR|nr:hypothetical protein DFP72DRAFT_850701 [Tulosesus angulatus]